MYGKQIMANENKINWTLVVLATIIGIGLWLIPSPFQIHKPLIVHTIDSTWVSYGIPDTTNELQGSHHGTSTSIITATTDDSTNYPYSFEKEIKDSSKAGILQIRTTVFPYTENDTLKAEITTEWNWEPRPIESIVRVDTVFIMKTVLVPENRPFYEEPLFVAPATASAVIAILLVTKQLIQFLSNEH